METEKHNNGSAAAEDPRKESKCTWHYIKSVCTWNFIKKVLQTAMLVMTWISMGSYMELSGPTLKDFVYRMGTNYTEVSAAVSGRSVGKFVGSIIGGFMTDIFGRFCYLQVAGGLTISALTSILMPWVRSPGLLWFMYFVLGTCLSIINIAGQRIALCIWLDKAASPMHVVHLGYGLGAFLAPIIANPFLGDFSSIEVSGTNVTSGIGNVTTTANLENVTANLENVTAIRNVSTVSPAGGKIIVSNIEHAYVIVAILAACVAGLFYAYQFSLIRGWRAQKKEKDDVQNDDTVESEPLQDMHENQLERKEAENKRQTEDKLFRKRKILEALNPASCAGGRLGFGCAILGFLFLKYLVYTALDRNLGLLLHSYATDQLGFSKTDASYLNSLFFIFYAVGRSVAFVAAMFISVKVLLMIESVSLLTVIIAAVAFARESSKALWVITALAGFFIGPMFPSGIAWGNEHIDMTGLAITWVFLGSAIGGVILLGNAGKLYDTYGPTTFIYLSLGFSLAVLFFDIILTCISVYNSRKLRAAQNQETEEDENE